MPRIVALTLWLAAVAACTDGDGADPPDSALSISALQGAGAESPFAGETVTVSGIVTGDFQDGDDDRRNDLGGFYLQSAGGDGDPATSDGIFVFDANVPLQDVSVGDRVVVAGEVQEYFGETQLVATSVTLAGRGSVTPVDIELPTATTLVNSDGDPVAGLERFEGMLVRLPQTMTVTDLFDLPRYGAVGLSAEGRLYQFTNGNRPGRDGYAAHRRTNAARTVVLDDGQRRADPDPLRLLDGATRTNGALRVGDSVRGVSGNLRYSRGSGAQGDETWRLMPAGDVAFEAANPRPAPPDIGGRLRVASFNVLNYFSTVDRNQPLCGPRRDENCRGADSEQEQQRQLAKIVTALRQVDADIVGLIELENNATASLEDIVDALNAATAAGTYTWLDTGTIGDDVIKTGFIFKPGTVRPTGDFALLDARVDRRFNDNRNRPALAQTFVEIASDESLTVVVNHLKSKGSDCDDDNDPNTGDGQGNCNLTRTRAVEAMLDWLAADPTDSGDPDVLVLGDLNAYLEEDPLRAFAAGGYENLIGAGELPAYSFVFDGQSGALDHALASPALKPQVVAAVEWHINADEPQLLDYNLEGNRDPGAFEADTPWRASDHDPVIVGLDLN